MKKILKNILVVTLLLSACLLVAKNNKNEFTVKYYDHVFTHLTPTSGFYVTKVIGTGVMEPFTVAYGTFEAISVGRGEFKIIQEGYSEACGLFVKIKSVGLTNAFYGDYEAISGEITLINTRKGNSAVTTDVIATGFYNPGDFDSLIIDLTGSFNSSFKPNKFKPCNKNNGFGNGDQDAPGNSGPHNNAENAGEFLDPFLEP